MGWTHAPTVLREVTSAKLRDALRGKRVEGHNLTAPAAEKGGALKERSAGTGGRGRGSWFVVPPSHFFGEWTHRMKGSMYFFVKRVTKRCLRKSAGGKGPKARFSDGKFARPSNW